MPKVDEEDATSPIGVKTEGAMAPLEVCFGPHTTFS